MDASIQDRERKKKVTEVKIFNVPFDLGEIKEKPDILITYQAL